ncbi:hypothetical protein GQ600_15609 [Phytophthora cactorum]|nr:hypothetical protein GQ600_15609 [Phytophthora cactorum]
MAMDECVDTLVFLQSIAEMEKEKKITDAGCMRYQGADDELQNLAKKVSYHAYELVEKQYRVANGRKTYFTIRELQPKPASDKVHPPALELNLSSKYPVPDDESPDDDRACHTYQKQDSALRSSKYKVFSGTTKFRTAHDIATRIADIMSRNDTPTHRKMIAALKRFEEVVTEGVAPDRVGEAHKEANHLVQGTLLPPITLRDIARVLKSTYSLESAHDVLSQFPVKAGGARKQEFAKEVTPNEYATRVLYVSPKGFVEMYSCDG